MSRRLLFLVLAVGVCIGCSKSPYPTARVSGRVTVNGKPYANLTVAFQPIVTDKSVHPPPSSGGITDADGRYSLKIIGTEAAGSAGAVVGKHEVRISNFIERDPFDDGPPKTKPAIEIPAKYAAQGFTFEVPSGGTSKADFDLKVP